MIAMFRPVMLMSKEFSSRSSPSSCLLQIARMCTKGNHGKISNRSHGTRSEQDFRHCSSCLWSQQWKEETQRRTYSTRSRDLASAAPTATAPAGAGIKYTDIPLTSLRQSLAELLFRAKPTVPHWYFSVDIKMDAAMKLREEFNRALQKDNIKISVNDLVIKATALACMKVPQANSSWQGTFIRQYKSVNVCMSVDTPRGVVIPVVLAAEKKGLASISEETRSLALKARDNKLQPQDFEGGTVSVTNVGMIGVTSFPGMVNPPQACMVGVCCTKDILVPDEVSSLGHRRVKMMSVSLSCDHRVVDEEVAVHWLHHFKRLLERPDLMLL